MIHYNNEWSLHGYLERVMASLCLINAYIMANDNGFLMANHSDTRFIIHGWNGQPPRSVQSWWTFQPVVLDDRGGIKVNYTNVFIGCFW